MHRTTLAFLALAAAAVLAVAQDKAPVADAKAPAKAADTAPAEPTPTPTVPAQVMRRQKVSVMPTSFTSFGAAVQGDFVYLIGGHASPAHTYDREGFNRTFWRMNLRDETWEVLPGGVGLQSVALVSDGTRLYRVGGMTALNEVDAKAQLESTPKAAAYDPLTRQWADLPDMPAARSSHDALVVDGKLYVVGGWKLAADELARAADEGAWHDTALVLDPKADKPEWKSIAQPFKRRALALAQAGGKLYAIGGMTETGMSAAVDLYDAARNEWSKGPDLPGTAFGTSAVNLNGRVYATTMEGDLFSHAPGEESWRNEGTLTFPRFFHRLLPAGNQLIAIAGTTRGGHLRNIEWITPGATGPGLTHLQIPAPGIAKTRQGIFFFNNTLYAFGGNTSTKDHQFKPENFTDEAFKLSLVTLRAERLATAPVKRQSFVTYVEGLNDRFGDKIGMAIGGFGHNGEAAVSHADIYEYDLEADIWSQSKVSLPARLTQFGLAHHGGKVYLFGGMDFDPARGKKEQFQESDAVWCYDPKAEKPEFVKLETKLPTKRRAFGGALLGDKYYIVGGMTKDFAEVDQVDVYDFKTGKWEVATSPDTLRLSPKLIPLNGKLYLLGGSSLTEDGFKGDRSIEEFDPATGKWRVAVENIGLELGEAQAFAFGKRLLLYSAHNAEGVLNFVWIEP